MGRYVYPIDLLELDDEPSSSGPYGHLNAEQRFEALETLWKSLSPGLKNLIRDHIEYESTGHTVDEPGGTSAMHEDAG